MKVLLSWMREFAPDLTDDVDVLSEALDDLGTPVEERVRLGEGLDGIVVARVLETKPHPDADRVQLVDVDAGDGEALQIVCGAFNMAAGDLIPLATLGTTMPNGMAIERRKMRGEWSNGMLCSATEIGLGEDSEGILILSPGLTPGQPLTEALGLQGDWLLDLEVNANRPDALSMVGVARDVAARLGVGFTLPSVDRADGWRLQPGGRFGRDRGRRRLPPLRRPRAAGRDHRPVADLAGQPHHPGGHAAHQQRGRRLQLRHARAGSPQPRLRPGQGGRRSPAGPLCPRRRAAGHPRRRRALVPGRGRPHLRR